MIPSWIFSFVLVYLIKLTNLMQSLQKLLFGTCVSWMRQREQTAGSGSRWQEGRLCSAYLPRDDTQSPLPIDANVAQHIFRICNFDLSPESAGYHMKTDISRVPSPRQCKKHIIISIYLLNAREPSFIFCLLVCFDLVVKFLLFMFLQMKRLGFDAIK